MSIILNNFKQEVNTNISNIINKDDILFISELTKHEREVLVEYKKFKKENNNFNLYESLRPEYKDKLEDVNSINENFKYLPEKFKQKIIKAVEYATGLKFKNASRLATSYYIPERGGFWSETEKDIHNFLEYKKQVIAFTLYTKLKTISQFPRHTLARLDWTDEQINEWAEFQADRRKRSSKVSKREKCHLHWRRQIRREINDLTEWISNILRFANDKHPFVSSHTLSRFRAIQGTFKVLRNS